MLGPADIEAWSEDLADDLVAGLAAAGWREAPPPLCLTRRQRRLFDRFRGGRALSLGELHDLSSALRRG